MGERFEVRVPDIGDFDAVDVVEVLVGSGDQVGLDDPLITLESDKASMEVPASRAGKVVEVSVAVGDKVGAGDLVAVLELEEGGSASKAQPASESQSKAQSHAQSKAESKAPAMAAPEPQSEPPSPQEEGATDEVSAPATEPAGVVFDVDLVVLGSGPGGYAAAFRAADLGLRVVLIERYPRLGGVCLNVGCIPSKALLHAARVIDETAEFAERGLRFGPPELDLDKLRAWKDGVVERLTSGLVQLAKRRKVEIVTGTGRFIGLHAVAVTLPDGSERTISFAQAIIATGSRVVEIPGIPYEDPRVMSSTGALELRDVPARLLVVGGGIIGLELATVYAALGSRITVVELTDTLLPGTDPDLVRPLQRRIAARYEHLLLGTRVVEVKAQKNGLVASFAGKQAPEKAMIFDRVLVAVGRRPNGDTVNAPLAGVSVDERGFIPVDDQQRTNVAHIFAIGDVARPPMLAHKASFEGKVAAEVAAGLRSGFDASVIPSVAYTDPEIAWVGITELEAKAQSIALEKATYPWAASGRSLALGRDEGMTKLLFDPETHRLVGGGIVGSNAGELIGEVGHAIEMGSTASDLALTIHAHPTLSETIAFAAEVLEGTVVDIYAPKRKAAKRPR